MSSKDSKTSVELVELLADTPRWKAVSTMVHGLMRYGHDQRQDEDESEYCDVDRDEEGTKRKQGPASTKRKRWPPLERIRAQRLAALTEISAATMTMGV